MAFKLLSRPIGVVLAEIVRQRHHSRDLRPRRRHATVLKSQISHIMGNTKMVITWLPRLGPCRCVSRIGVRISSLARVTCVIVTMGCRRHVHAMSSGTAIFLSTRHRAPDTIHGSLMGQFFLHVTVRMVRAPLGVERDGLVKQLVLSPTAEREGHHEENENQADKSA